MQKEKKKGSCLKTILIVIGVFIIIGFIGSLGDENDKGTADANTSEPAVSDSPTSSPDADPQVDNNQESLDEEQEDSSSDDGNIAMFDFSDPDVGYANIDISDLSIKHGELLSVIQSEGSVIVVNAKIEASLTNKMTIDQNYFNVADLVKNHGFNTCNELQYWAVADMSDGREAKCISFELDKETIDALFNENIVENQLGDYATNLWILPSLQD